jgi:hypothetical protein
MLLETAYIITQQSKVVGITVSEHDLVNMYQYMSNLILKQYAINNFYFGSQNNSFRARPHEHVSIRIKFDLKTVRHK